MSETKWRCRERKIPPARIEVVMLMWKAAWSLNLLVVAGITEFWWTLAPFCKVWRHLGQTKCVNAKTFYLLLNRCSPKFQPI